MSKIKSFLLAVISVCVIMGCQKETKPNIILIVADDLGWKDLGCMGSTYFETPNIDQLAKDGIRFTQAYAGASNCAPSRACLMTGTNTPRHGVYTVSPSTRGNVKTRKLIPTINTDTIPTTTMTLGRELQLLGYTTATMGKWHLGSDPLKQGFDVNVAGSIWGHPESYWAPYKKPALEAPKGEYLTDRITSEAISFIDKNKEKPFFLYLPYYAVHTPIQGKPHLAEKYKAKEANNCQANPEYGALVTNMDSCIGAILTKVKELELESNTIVLFTSDNGGIYRISCQKPLRGGKGSYYEGGVRVPLIIKHPGFIKENTVNHEQVSNLDFYPTILDLIDEKPKNNLLDGISLKGLLYHDESLQKRPLFWHFPIYLQAYKNSSDQWQDPLFRTRPGTAMRFGDWKLIEYFENGDLELYNLKNDMGEQTNLSDSLPDTTKELHQMMIDWRNKTNAPVPCEENTEYDQTFEKEKILNAKKND